MFYFSIFPLALAVSWSRPIIVAVAFLSLSCFRLHEAFPDLLELQLPYAFAAMTLGVVCLHLASGRMKPFMRPELKFALLFALHVTIGMAFAVDRTVAWDAWTGNFIKVIAMTLAVAWLMKFPRDCRSVSIIILLSGVLVAWVAIDNFVNNVGLIEGGRVTIGLAIKSILADPNDLAFALLFSVAFGMGLVFDRKAGGLLRALALIALVMVVTAIVLTKSRGGMIGTLAVLGVFFLQRFRSFIIPAIVVAIAGLALYSLSGIGARGYSGDLDSALDDSSAGRLIFWWAGVRMAIFRPIFGVGLDCFVSDFWRYAHEFDNRDHAVHSIWFGVLAETGFVGFALYMTMIVSAARSIWRMVSDPLFKQNGGILYTFALAMLGGFAGTCAAGTFLTQAYSWPVFMQVAMISALAYHAEKNNLLSPAAAVVPKGKAVRKGKAAPAHAIPAA